MSTPIQITIKSHYSASELASMNLPGLPTHRNSMTNKALTECWDIKTVSGGRGIGGIRREYAPPTEVMELIKSKAARQLVSLKDSPVTAIAMTQQLSNETDLQTQITDARRGVVVALEKLQQGSGYTLKKACSVLIDMARVGTATPQLVTMLKLARDGRGRRSADGLPSVRSLMRFVEQEKNGNLTPQLSREKDLDIPAWANAFLAIYQVPSKPSVSHAYRVFVEQYQDTELPSIHQVRRFLTKMGNVSRQVKRMGPRELKTILPFVRRDFSKLLPCDIYSADGHTFDAEVQNPFSGKPFRPEITTVIDIATRRVVGWSVGLAESALVVLDAIRHACLTSGIPAIFYVDNGSGYKNQLMNDKAIGLMGRVGITLKHSLPYSSQARGVIERVHQTIWVTAARELPGYMGRDMDREQLLETYKLSRNAVKKGGAMPLLSWDNFVEFCNDRIAKYNNEPHSSLERITDPVSGKRRYITPNESWAQFVQDGFNPVVVTDDETRPLFRPRVLRTVIRGEVKLFNNIYFSNLLTEFHGDQLQVGYDVHDAHKVWLYDDKGRFICTADWNGNLKDYMPKDVVAQAKDKRADAALKLLDAKRETIEAERRGVPVIEADTSVNVPGFLDMDIAQLAQRAKEIKESRYVQEDVIDVTPQQLVQEHTTEDVWSVPQTPNERYEQFLLMEGLDDSELSCDKQRKWRTTYQKSTEFRAFKRRTA